MPLHGRTCPQRSRIHSLVSGVVGTVHRRQGKEGNRIADKMLNLKMEVHYLEYTDFASAAVPTHITQDPTYATHYDADLLFAPLSHIRLSNPNHIIYMPSVCVISYIYLY